MNREELDTAVAEILAAEERTPVDWLRVKSLCDRVIQRLNTEPALDRPNELYQFLEDYDAREKDERRAQTAYADRQRAFVREYLENRDG